MALSPPCTSRAVLHTHGSRIPADSVRFEGEVADRGCVTRPSLMKRETDEPSIPVPSCREARRLDSGVNEAKLAVACNRGTNVPWSLLGGVDGDALRAPWPPNCLPGEVSEAGEISYPERLKYAHQACLLRSESDLLRASARRAHAAMKKRNYTLLRVDFKEIKLSLALSRGEASQEYGGRNAKVAVPGGGANFRRPSTSPKAGKRCGRRI